MTPQPETQGQAALIEALAQEADKRMTIAYLAHGHVYTEEPERTIDILRDVLARALAAHQAEIVQLRQERDHYKAACATWEETAKEWREIFRHG